MTPTPTPTDFLRRLEDHVAELDPDLQRFAIAAGRAAWQRFASGEAYAAIPRALDVVSVTIFGRAGILAELDQHRCWARSDDGRTSLLVCLLDEDHDGDHGWAYARGQAHGFGARGRTPPTIDPIGSERSGLALTDLVNGAVADAHDHGQPYASAWDVGPW